MPNDRLDDIDSEISDGWCDKFVIDGTEMSHSDIAAVFGITVPAVKKIEEAALSRIRSNPEHMALLVQYLQWRNDNEHDEIQTH